MTEGQAEVVQIVSQEQGIASSANATAFYAGERTEPVCITPCTVNLRYGSYKLRAVSQQDKNEYANFNIMVGKSPSVARVAMGKNEPMGAGTVVGGVLLMTLGGIAATTGGVLAAVGEDEVGTPLLVGGGLGIVGGALLFAFDPFVKQEGSVVQFKVPRSSRESESAPPPSSPTPSESSGCAADNECKGDRICVHGECVNP